MTTTLIDTRKEFDAGRLGYDGPRDPMTSGEGLIVTTERVRGIPYVKLIGPDGEVELGGAPEIRVVIEALCMALRPQRSELAQVCFDIAAAGAR